jgi:hypothetical protein
MEKKLEWRRMTGEAVGTCIPCNTMTNRLVTFRAPGDANWQALFICDDCLEGIKGVEVRPRVDG